MLLVAALSSTRQGRAETEPAPMPPAPAASATPAPGEEPAQLTKATQLFWEAHARFERGDYAGALELFQQTYAIRPEPEVMFNIALTQERLGQCEAARTSYRDYLAGAEAANHPRAREQLERLDETCTPAPVSPPPEATAPAAAPAVDPGAVEVSVRPPPPAPPADTVAAQPIAPVGAEPPDSASSTRQILGWAALGVATVALGTAVYFEVERRKEQDAYNDIKGAADPPKDQGGQASDHYSAHNRYRTLAWTTATAAGILAVTGGVLLLYDPSGAATAGGAPSKLGFALSATGRF